MARHHAEHDVDAVRSHEGVDALGTAKGQHAANRPQAFLGGMRVRDEAVRHADHRLQCAAPRLTLSERSYLAELGHERAACGRGVRIILTHHVV